MKDLTQIFKDNEFVSPTGRRKIDPEKLKNKRREQRRAERRYKRILEDENR